MSHVGVHRGRGREVSPTTGCDIKLFGATHFYFFVNDQSKKDYQDFGNVPRRCHSYRYAKAAFLLDPPF